LLCELGWQPRRTIIFAHWDAGDMGQLGSYEWVEVFILRLLSPLHCINTCEHLERRGDGRHFSGPKWQWFDFNYIFTCLMWATVSPLLCLVVRFYCYFIHVYFLLVLWTNKRIRIQIWRVRVTNIRVNNALCLHVKVLLGRPSDCWWWHLLVVCGTNESR